MTLREEETVKEQLNSDLLDRLSLKGLLQVRKETARKQETHMKLAMKQEHLFRKVLSGRIAKIP